MGDEGVEEGRAVGVQTSSANEWAKEAKSVCLVLPMNNKLCKILVDQNAQFSRFFHSLLTRFFHSLLTRFFHSLLTRFFHFTTRCLS